MDKHLSLADISRHFALPESTARYYCKRFAHFMPIYGEGRRRRYGQESLAVVACIVEQMKLGKNANQVEEELDLHFARTTDTFSINEESDNMYYPVSNVQESHAPAKVPEYNAPQNISGGMPDMVNAQYIMKLLEHQTVAMQSIAQSLSFLSGQHKDMEELSEAAKLATEENILLRQEVISLKTQLFNTEQVHQDDLSQIHTWMGRLAKSFNSKTQMDTKAQEDKAEMPATEQEESEELTATQEEFEELTATQEESEELAVAQDAPEEITATQNASEELVEVKEDNKGSVE